jgi:outer membrane protein TolC
MLAPAASSAQQGGQPQDGGQEAAPGPTGPLNLEQMIDPSVVVPDADAPVITLEELLARAEAEGGNLDLVQLQERFELSNNNVRRAWASLLPIANFAASYTRNSTAAVLGFPNFFAPVTLVDLGDGTTQINWSDVFEAPILEENQWGAVLDVGVPLLVMPAYYGISAANAGQRANEQSITFARNELFLGITQSYYGAVAARRLIGVAAAQTESAKEAERVARARFEVGATPKVDYLRASVQRARFEQDLRRAQNAYVVAKLALAQLAGIEETFSVEEPPAVETPQGTVDGLVATALESRKDLGASRSAVESAERALKAQWWRFAPILTANGQYRWSNVAGFTGENQTWAVTVNAVFTIFDYARYPDLDDARSNLRSAQASREATARQVERDVKQALLDLESAQANLIKAQEAASLSEESLRLVNAQYEAGTATYLDVIDANSALFASRVSEVTEKLNTQVASLLLSRAIGQFGVERFP